MSCHVVVEKEPYLEKVHVGLRNVCDPWLAHRPELDCTIRYVCKNRERDISVKGLMWRKAGTPRYLGSRVLWPRFRSTSMKAFVLKLWSPGDKKNLQSEGTSTTSFPHTVTVLCLAAIEMAWFNVRMNEIWLGWKRTNVNCTSSIVSIRTHAYTVWIKKCCF